MRVHQNHPSHAELESGAGVAHVTRMLVDCWRLGLLRAHDLNASLMVILALQGEKL